MSDKSQNIRASELEEWVLANSEDAAFELGNYRYELERLRELANHVPALLKACEYMAQSTRVLCHLSPTQTVPAESGLYEVERLIENVKASLK